MGHGEVVGGEEEPLPVGIAKLWEGASRHRQGCRLPDAEQSPVGRRLEELVPGHDAGAGTDGLPDRLHHERPPPRRERSRVDAAEERRPRVIDDPAEEVPERDPLARRDVHHLPHRNQGGGLRVEPDPLLLRQLPPLLAEKEFPRWDPLRPREVMGGEGGEEVGLLGRDPDGAEGVHDVELPSPSKLGEV
jgi:hypothetical protein